MFTESDYLGGAEIVTGYLLAALDPKIRVTVIGVDADVVASLVAARAGATAHVVPSIGNRFAHGAMRANRRVIAELRPDIFQAGLTWTGSCRWPLLLASTVRGVRPVAVEHSPLSSPTKSAARVKRFLEGRLAAHVAVGASVAAEVERLLMPRRASIRVIHNGVPERPKSSTREHRAGFTIGTVARLDQMKGVDVLLRAAVAVPHARVVVVGDGPDAHELEQLATDLGISARTEFVGWVDDPRPLLDTFDVFVSSSRAEGLSIAICEAMLDGVATVATDVGDVHELIDQGRTGFVIPVDDVGALSADLSMLAQDETRRRRIAEAGRAHAAEHFTARAMATNYERLYRELVPTAAADR